MAAPSSPNERARTFFLNEQHELAHAEKAGGGGTAKYGTIDWVAKARNLGHALQNSRSAIAGSQDPLRDRHYFLIARPEPQVPKISESKNDPGEYFEETEYDGIHSRVFRRLGMDLLEVAHDGTAAVHATTERLARLYSTALDLAQEGPQEQSRWATIKTFEPIPARFRLDDDWFATLRRDAIVDVVVELQPLLTRIEVEEVLSALVQSLSTNAHESVWGTGADFSGRRWLRARVRRPSVRRIADTFFSVQSLHPPFTTAVAALSRGGRRATPAAAFAGPPAGADLPTVAVVDTGIPEDHPELSAYVRSRYRLPDAPAAYLGSHGSLVASRIIFGDLNFDSGLAPRAPGQCRVIDVMVADGAASISDKAVCRRSKRSLARPRTYVCST